MAVPWSAIAGAGIGGSLELLGGGLAALYNAQEAKKNRDFQERMVRNRYQYQMEDLRKAGLNPILLSAGASPPGAPGGAVARMQNPAQNFSAKGLAAGLARSQQHLLDAQRLESIAKQTQALAQAGLADQQAVTQKEVTAARQIENRIRTLQIPEARANAALWEALGPDAGGSAKAAAAASKVVPLRAGKQAAARAGKWTWSKWRGRTRKWNPKKGTEYVPKGTTDMDALLGIPY